MVVRDENAFFAEGNMTIEGIQEHFLCPTRGATRMAALLAKTGAGAFLTRLESVITIS